MGARPRAVLSDGRRIAVSRERRVCHPGAVGTDAVVTLDSDEAHHVTRVLRLREGDALGVFDGRGREWEGVVVEAGRVGVRVRLDDERTDPVDPALEVVLYQGICRPDRMDWIVQKAVEVGASALRTVCTARSEVSRPSPARLERWRRIAREACKQSGRRRIPEVDDVEGLPPAAGVFALALAPGPDVPPLGARLGAPRERAVWLAVGPEGGFGDEEVSDLTARGWRTASLGPRTLRTETAGLVACALVLHAWGDLGTVPGSGPGV